MKKSAAGMDAATETMAPAPGRWRRARIVVRCLLVIAALAGMGTFAAGRWALNKTQEVPDFYLQATARMPVDLKAASEELETEVHELTTQVGRLGSWHATFTESQINAWLVHQLPREFAKMLPKGVEDPRVVIQEDKVLAAARYKDTRIETVISFELGIQLTSEPNVLAIEVRNLRAGALPLPLSRFVDHITRRAARDDIEVRWDRNEEGFPIALLTVPSEHPAYLRTPVIVESVTMSEGGLRLAGHTGPDAPLAYRPRGPVYRMASLRTSGGRDSHCDSGASVNTRL